MNRTKISVGMAAFAATLVAIAFSATAADLCGSCGPRLHHRHKMHQHAMQPLGDVVSNPYYSGLDRSDTIAIDAGDAAAANIAVQTPNPWPDYLNDTEIENSGTMADQVMQEFYARHAEKVQAAPMVNFNITGAK